MKDELNLSEAEFIAAERMLAGLLADASSKEEEAMILMLHARIKRLFEQSAETRLSRERLHGLQAQRSTQ